ncbi:MAG: hypothetical protein KUG77_24225 [Nannocystaceae bacterium]|nr:hypothetical protein [Nannocystaceae bacterium]
MFRLSRLVWRDAASRYWAGLILVCMPCLYLWREWPPWVVRDTLWSLEPGALLWTCVVATVAYGALSTGPTRQLVVSKRLDYWRQQPISLSHWRVFHGTHLLLLHAPALGALSYLLVPAGSPISVGLPSVLAAATLGPAAWRLGHPVSETRALSVRLPSATSPSAALARILGLALVRRRPAMLAGIAGGGVLLATLGWIATSHLGTAGEPPGPAARGFCAAAMGLGAAAVWTAWPLVRREQWWLDALGADARVQRTACVLLAVGVMLPATLALLATAVRLEGIDALGLACVAACTVTWAGAAGLQLDADAVRRREPMARRAGRFVLVLVFPIPLSVVHPLAMMLPCAFAWWSSARIAEQAMVVRRRFELDDLEDDHD